MSPSQLFEKRLIFVSGKGGVGKTTVAVLLALSAARAHKRVLLVEMNSTGRIAPIFGAEAEGGGEVALAPYISGVNLSPKRCFEEFVLTQVRFRAIYETFFNNKYVTNFISATPGLNEILMLGKIWELEREMKSRLFRERQYDLVIVDAAATGHGLSSLEVPNILESAVKVGPLYKKAVNINALLADQEKTVMCLVTLAEEMPVAETAEFAQALRERTKISFGPIFVNALIPQPAPARVKSALPSHLQIYADYHRLARERFALQKNYLKIIDERFADYERIRLPFVFSGLGEAKSFEELLGALTIEGNHRGT